MAVDITRPDQVALCCTTTDMAFGPLFPSETAALAFLEYLQQRGQDARVLDSNGQLGAAVLAWLDTPEGRLHDTT